MSGPRPVCPERGRLTVTIVPEDIRAEPEQRLVDPSSMGPICSVSQTILHKLSLSERILDAECRDVVNRAVGFVGLGGQGGPMARRIVAAGHPLRIWARRATQLEPFATTQAVVAEDIAALGIGCGVVGVCVSADADVLEVVHGGLLDGMAAGSVLAIHSTVLPATCLDVAAAAQARGVRVIDAPVSGGGVAASQGRLAVSVGGSSEDFRAAEPVLRTFGDPVVHVGPLGAGEQAKLLNNLLFCAKNELLREVMEIGLGMGLDTMGLAAVLTHDATSGFATRLASGAMTPAAAAHALRMLRKDVGHASTIIEAAGLDAGSSAALASDLLRYLSSLSRTSS